MGQILFWLGAAVASVVLSSVSSCERACAQTKRKRRQADLAMVMTVILWGLVVGGFALVKWSSGGGGFPLTAASIAAGLSVVGMLVVALYGRRPAKQADSSIGPAAATWRPGRLLVVWFLLQAHMALTFWILDLDVRSDMAALREDARTMVVLASHRSIPDSENAAILYRRAWEQLDARDAENVENAEEAPDDPEDLSGFPWDLDVSLWLDPIENGAEAEFEPDHPGMLAFIQTCESQLALLREAGQRPGCSFRVEGDPQSLYPCPPGLWNMTDLARLLCLSARVNAHRGRMAAALDDLNACFAMANHCAGDRMLYACRVAAAVERVAFESLQYMFDQAAPAATDLGRIRIRRIPSYNEAYARDLYMDEAKGLEKCGSFDSRSVSEIRPSRGDIPLAPVFDAIYRVFFWEDDVRSYRQGMRRMRRMHQLAARPYHQSRDEWKATEGLTMGESYKGILGLMYGTSGHCADGVAVADTSHRLAIVGVAMLRYRSARGVYPDSLDELVSSDVGDLAAVPVDPFSGDPLKLARTGDGLTVIYSVGTDLVDDGGTAAAKWYEDGDLVLTLPQ